MRKFYLLFLLPILLYFGLIIFSPTQRENYKNLEGTWRFSMDPENTGEKSQWFNNTLTETTTLPSKIDESKNPEYVGVAWYQCDFDVPKEWEGKPVTLKLERILCESKVWIDGQLMNEDESITSPVYSATTGSLKEGKHTLTLRLDNQAKPTDTDPSLTQDAPTNTELKWNGVMGELSLSVPE